jgi:predicted dehydrogenase
MSIITRLVKHYYPPTSPSSSKPLKFGILGAANIAPNALITPARTHPDVQIYAVAARSLDRAREFAQNHGIEKAYGSYDELLNDGEVDVVYNPVRRISNSIDWVR